MSLRLRNMAFVQPIAVETQESPELNGDIELFRPMASRHDQIKYRRVFAP